MDQRKEWSIRTIFIQNLEVLLESVEGSTNWHSSGLGNDWIQQNSHLRAKATFSRHMQTQCHADVYNRKWVSFPWFFKRFSLLKVSFSIQIYSQLFLHIKQLHKVADSWFPEIISFWSHFHVCVHCSLHDGLFIKIYPQIRKLIKNFIFIEVVLRQNSALALFFPDETIPSIIVGVLCIILQFDAHHGSTSSLVGRSGWRNSGFWCRIYSGQ